MTTDRRAFLSTAVVAAGATIATASAPAADSDKSPDKTYRIGVISSRIQGNPQKTNGHTWHFAQYFHPDINLDAIGKYLDPGSVRLFKNYLRNPQTTFGRWPFPDTRITHYYEQDPVIAQMFTEAFPGVKVARSVDEMVQEVDAVWMGDASGIGEDHFDLVAPGLAKGLPTFCDKPIGGSVAETRRILDFAVKHKTPIMSSSLFRHQWGTEEALRMKQSGEFGDLQYVIASQGGGGSPDGWLVYGQHPTWMAMTLCGPGVEAVNFYAYKNSCHALMTYADRMPAEVWCGRPDITGQYCSTAVHFAKKVYQYTPAIEGNYWLGHHYQMLNMADAFRQMIKTRVEPVPHQEILEVTAIIHAGVKSMAEKSRLVTLAEVMA